MPKKNEQFISLYRVTNTKSGQVFEARGWKNICAQIGINQNINQLKRSKKWTVEVLEPPAVWDETWYRKNLYRKSKDRYPEYEQRKFIKDPLYEKRKRLKTQGWLNPDQTPFTAEQHVEWLKQPCTICSTTQDIVVDHCHTSNIVRSPLCRKCNLTLGFCDDSIEKLMKMIEYLKVFKND